MFFRNLHFHRFSEAVAATLTGLQDHLDTKRLRACGPLEQSTRGFVSPYGRDNDQLTHAGNDFTLIAVGGEDKILPARVVNESLAQRIQNISEQENRKVGGKERKRLKEEIITDLLPRAFVDYRRTFAYLDLRGGWLVVDSSSRSIAEGVLSELREAIGTLPAVPMQPAESPRVLMTDWALNGNLPAGLVLGEEVELRDPSEGGAIIKCRRQDLEAEEVREHIKTGKQVFALALQFDDRISFVLGEDLVIRKLRFLDQILDELGGVENDSAVAELDSRFALMTLEVERLTKKLDEWFWLERPGDNE